MLLDAVLLYCGAGFVFALIFVTVLAARMDHGTDGASFWFRLIVIPGIVLLWPYLLLRALFGFKFKG